MTTSVCLGNGGFLSFDPVGTSLLLNECIDD